MHLLPALNQLGLSTIEARIYLAALKLGECLITDIAHDTGLPRSTVAETLENLHVRGLINYFYQHRRKHWYAEPPKKLQTLQEEQNRVLQSILPKLEKIRTINLNAFKTNVYSGSSHLIQILENILEAKHNFKVILNWEDWQVIFEKEILEDFTQKRLEHNLKLELLTTSIDGVEILFQNGPKHLGSFKLVPPNYPVTQSAILVFGSNLGLISLNPNSPTGVVIEDPHLTNTINLMFNLLWTNS